MKTLKHLFLCATLLLAPLAHAAERPDDSAALAGVETGKVIFDINMGDPKKMTLYLTVIGQTVDDLERQGVEPDVILAFRGHSVKLVSTDRESFELTDFEHLDRIAEQVAELQKRGVRMEACSVACRLFNVEQTTLLEGIKPVGNTFVSLTGYQAQGYANIPIY